MDALSIVVALMALALGLAAGWIWARGRAAAEAQAAAESARRALEGVTGQLQTALREIDAARAELGAFRTAAEEQRKTAEQLRGEIKAEFAQLSQEALKSNNELFLTQAGTRADASVTKLAEMLGPFKTTLEKLETETKALEGARKEAYGSLAEKLGSLQQATAALHSSSHALATALRGDARARGRWGEVALKNIAQFAGMTPHCDFAEQETADDGSRPDMIVNLPGGDGRIPIDAKVPMDAYMSGFEATDPDVRRAALVKHAQDMRKHMRTLAGRDYAQSLGSRVDYTVMFVPAEPVLAAAFEHDPSLQQDAMEKRVLLATPVTLVALLLNVALYWRQTLVAEQAHEISDSAREFKDRVTTFAEHLEKVGKGLRSAVDNYNNAVGSYESRVLPQGRKLEDLGLSSRGADGSLPELEPIDRGPRAIEAPMSPAAPPAAPPPAPSPTPLLDRSLGAS